MSKAIVYIKLSFPSIKLYDESTTCNNLGRYKKLLLKSSKKKCIIVVKFDNDRPQWLNDYLRECTHVVLTDISTLLIMNKGKSLVMNETNMSQNRLENTINNIISPKEQIKCVVCFDEFEGNKIITRFCKNCNDCMVCSSCFTKLCETNSKCPMCRGETKNHIDNELNEYMLKTIFKNL